MESNLAINKSNFWIYFCFCAFPGHCECCLNRRNPGTINSKLVLMRHCKRSALWSRWYIHTSNTHKKIARQKKLKKNSLCSTLCNWIMSACVESFFLWYSSCGIEFSRKKFAFFGAGQTRHFYTYLNTSTVAYVDSFEFMFNYYIHSMIRLCDTNFDSHWIVRMDSLYFWELFWCLSSTHFSFTIYFVKRSIWKMMSNTTECNIGTSKCAQFTLVESVSIKKNSTEKGLRLAISCLNGSTGWAHEIGLFSKVW